MASGGLAESFLCEAGATTVRGSQQTIEREEASYERLNDTFRIRDRTFASQFFDIYKARIAKLRDAVGAQAAHHWLNGVNIDGNVHHPRLLDHVLDLEVGVPAVVVGTVYKHYPLMPTVLEVYAKQRAIIAPPPRDSYISDDDIIGLEDEGGRVKLIPSPEPSPSAGNEWGPQALQRDKLLHGQVIAVLGTVLESGAMAVHAYCTAGPPPQTSAPPALGRGTGLLEGTSRYVAIVSGLQGTNDLQKDLMLDFLQGHGGSALEQGHLQQRIVRVIIAGNSIPRMRKSEADDDLAFQRRRGDLGATAEQLEHAALIKHVDLTLANLSACIPVDLMPGPSDPANHSLPQQPLNHCLFPISNRYASFHRVTNPHQCEVGDIVIVGTSGQEMASMRRFVKVESTLELMKSLLTTRHLAPAAPDTVAAYPCEGTDPFVLEQCPHIYFIGNQERFEAELFEGPNGQVTRLLSVPDFAKSPSIALVDIESLASYEVSFRVDL